MNESTKLAGRKMLFANLYDQREVDLVERLCTLEGISISNLMRRAIAGMVDEAGIERPAGVFDDRASGNRGRAKREVAIGLSMKRRGRQTDDERMRTQSFLSEESKK